MPDILLAAVDPGKNGAVAFETAPGSATFRAVAMPGTLRGLADLFDDWKAQNAAQGVSVLIEQVGGYMQGNAAPSAVVFGRHLGNLESTLVTLKIPFDWILPARWIHWLIGKPEYSPLPALPPKTKPLSEDYKRIQKERKKINAQRKRERKKKILERVQQKHPEIKMTLANADAVGILMYAQSSRPTLGLESISEKP